MKKVLIIFVLLLLLCLGPFLAPQDPYTVDLSHALQGSSTSNWLGTDNLGRDVLSRLLTGAPTTVGLSMVALLFSTMVGVPIGMYAGIGSKGRDWTLMRVTDTFLSFPEYVIAIVITGIMGPGVLNLIFAIVVVKWVGYARLARSIVMEEKHKDYVISARISGASSTRIVREHLLVHIAGPVLALATLDMGKIVLLVASLSFLGLGVPQPSPEWGAMLSEGRTYFVEAPSLMIYPGLAILLVVLLTSVAGDQLTHRFSGGRR
ncbi:putative oligopeptide ABC transport system membrane protein [Corynebacterium kutscheri]|uniref:Oligopeptide ABC transport system membrane protein n=1 Tax=Corynebacterium kutscheri TaxID=35755 RepID=A0AB38VVR5_9CORY|nr:nickel transporter permease [Corynebacterium kutscheri]VEH06912.1 putative oligopeptide ABC transport system membrane protein [Corynebacterium kutscheri]VEH79408.1 putative oligopeptide ABC transport system membrane protein [Corynebacterium kutscheri]